MFVPVFDYPEIDMTTERSRRWKIIGHYHKGKPFYNLMEWDIETREFVFIKLPRKGMKLKEIKNYILELYPKYRIYKRYRTNGREFWGFVPENPKYDSGFVNPRKKKTDHELWRDAYNDLVNGEMSTNSDSLGRKKND